MTLLFRILRAAHANGTHHKLALDALTHLKGPDADAWQRLFLSQAELYLDGSKAPDKEFKDFKNHVLHVRDGLWGGAPEKARNWYNHLVEALTARNWEMAVYCAGVLSHYYTDPIHPFHTAQSEAENNIHRALEWSVSKSYNELYRQAAASHANMTVAMPEGANWLAEAVVAGARHANPQYERLIAHYDINRGVTDPPGGLDRVAKRTIGELLRYAAIGYAGILERAFAEAGVAPPRVSLAVETVLAGLKIPVRWLTNRLEDRAEAALVQRMYDELQTTGTVEVNLPEDDRKVRDLFAAQVTAMRVEPSTSERFPLPAKCRKRPAVPAAEKVAAAAAAPDSLARLQPRQAAETATPATSVPTVATIPAAIAAPDSAGNERRGSRHGNRFFLSMNDDIVDAPSIGPKTAARLQELGIFTVADLMQQDAERIAERATADYITSATVTDWQDQARLMCIVPRLRTPHAQLLVGAGYREARAIAETDQNTMLADILRFVGTKEGQRVLRDGSPPDLDNVIGWIRQAADAERSRAA